MKNTLIAFAMGLFFAASSSHAVRVSIEAASLHVPLGFDGNDESEVGVVVNLPNTCHRRPFGVVDILGNDIRIEMKAEKISVARGNSCIQAIVPVLVSVPLGVLAQGRYNVTVNYGQATEKEAFLTVANPGSESIDNFTYANVTNVRRSGEGSTIYLEGFHPSSCMEIERVEMIANEYGDTIAVLPIVTQKEPICDTMEKPFLKEVSLVTRNAADVVLHVRKLDGRALNFRL